MLTMVSMFEPKRPRAPIDESLVVSIGISLGICAIVAAMVLPQLMCSYDVDDDAVVQLQVDGLARRLDRETCLDPENTDPTDLRDPWNREVRVFCYGGFVRVISTGPDRTLWTDDDVRSGGDGYEDP